MCFTAYSEVDGTIRNEGPRGDEIRTIAGYPPYISVLALKVVPPEGPLISAAEDATLRVWNPWDGTLMQTVPLVADVALLRARQDAVYAIDVDGYLQIWDLVSI